MHGEVPKFKRCCFCVPLRRGLIAWGYAKIILDALFIAFITVLILCFAFWLISVRDLVIFSVVIAFLLVDVCFNIIFVVASHKKSVMLLNVYYIYNMVWLGLVVLGNCLQLYANFCYVRRVWGFDHYSPYYVGSNVLVSLALGFSLLIIQIYLILLIRSEIAKLREQSLEMQFSNHLASGEPQCTLHNATEPERGQSKAQVLQDDCTLHNETEVDQWESKTQVVQDC